MFYIPSTALLPFLHWLKFNGADPLTLSHDELQNQWATFCKIQVQEGEA